MKMKFDEEIRKVLSEKWADNNAYLSVEEYQVQLEALKKAKEALQVKGCKKTMSDYWLVRKYDILTINGTERLI